jgi:hypothetical protein
MQIPALSHETTAIRELPQWNCPRKFPAVTLVDPSAAAGNDAPGNTCTCHQKRTDERRCEVESQANKACHSYNQPSHWSSPTFRRAKFQSRSWLTAAPNSKSAPVAAVN